ncbi:MAG TPA: hypothetical protein P5550_07065 [Bacteroidales bacterium]|nr:hypothetical protein [Bacteroidales bacterium]HRZ77796.1 hypothetical protein [Bacteroidales bacterium]
MTRWQAFFNLALLVLLGAVLWLSLHQRRQLGLALERLEAARTDILSASASNQEALQQAEVLRFELQRTADSFDILLAERDSMIFAFERWGSDEKYRRYNARLREQTARLDVLRDRYHELKRSRTPQP